MGKMTLFTMPPSHFCEKARWALDLLGRPYVEERYPPYFNRAALKRNGGGATVPFLVLENNKGLYDSDEILKWVDSMASDANKLYPTDPENGPLVRDFCNRCERDMAPQVVRFFFHYLDKEQYFNICTQGCQLEQIKKFRYMGWLIRAGMNFKLKINTDGYRDAVRRLNKFYDAVDALLHDGRKYLFCNRLTAADITFCALAHNTILTPEFGGASLLYEECPPQLKPDLDRYRTSKPGIYLQAMYKRFRKYKFE